MIGEDQEVETRAGSSGRHIVDRSGAVGAARVYVERASDRVAPRLPGRGPRIHCWRRQGRDAGDENGRS